MLTQQPNLPHEGTRKGKRPVLAALHCGRSFSRRRTPRPSVQQGISFWRDDRSACWATRRRAWVVGARLLLPVLEPELELELELGVCAEEKDSAPSFELLTE